MRVGLLATLVALSALAWPTSARACSPLYPAAIVHIFPAGPSHPANAPVYVVGGQLSAHELVATVDGSFVRVDVDPRRSRYIETDYGYQWMVLTLDPMPEPGQVVRIEGPTCFGGCDLEMEYVASEPFEEVVPPLEALRFSRESRQVADPWHGSGSCGTPPRVAGVSAVVRAPETDVGLDAWRFVEVTVDDDGEVVDRYLAPPGDPDTYASFRLTATQVGYPAEVESLCVTARLITLTSEGPPTTVCQPCERRGPTDPMACVPADAHCPFVPVHHVDDPPPPPCDAGGCSVGAGALSTRCSPLLGLGVLLLLGARRRRTRARFTAVAVAVAVAALGSGCDGSSEASQARAAWTRACVRLSGCEPFARLQRPYVACAEQLIYRPDLDAAICVAEAATCAEATECVGLTIEDGCGTGIGVCERDVLRSCDSAPVSRDAGGGFLWWTSTRDCAAEGLVCHTVVPTHASEGFTRSMCVIPDQRCDEAFEPYCDGNAVVHCDRDEVGAGVLTRRRCLVGSCRDGACRGDGEPCDFGTWCEGDDAVTCLGGFLHRESCPPGTCSPEATGSLHEDGSRRCVAGSACSPRCEGSEVVRCVEGEEARYDCRQWGFETCVTDFSYYEPRCQ